MKALFIGLLLLAAGYIVVHDQQRLRNDSVERAAFEVLCRQAEGVPVQTLGGRLTCLDVREIKTLKVTK